MSFCEFENQKRLALRLPSQKISYLALQRLTQGKGLYSFQKFPNRLYVRYCPEQLERLLPRNSKKRYKNNSIHMARKSFVDTCFEKRTVIRQRSSRKASFEEQMSNEKYLSIFSRQMEAIMCTIYFIYFWQQAQFGHSIFPSFSRSILRHLILTNCVQIKIFDKI